MRMFGVVVRTLDSSSELLETAMSKVGAVCLASLSVLVVVGVLIRALRVPVLFVDEIAGYMMVAIVFLMAAESLRRGQFIRVSFALDRLGTRRRKQALLGANMVALFFMVVLYFHMWVVIIRSIQIGLTSQSVLQAPVYLTQVSAVVGLTLVVSRLALITYKSARALAEKDLTEG